jgi:dihydrofolate synthase/folylpolyglutamate synthase
MTYAAALERLFALRRFGVRPGLDGTRALLAALGRPERGLSTVHIAGTNGKGSTAAFAERVLRASGRKTGLYTSPHLLRFTERIRIDGEELDEGETAALAARVLAARPDGEATFFEATTAMAFLAFAAHGVEVAVIEAGLGGRLDATNAIERPLATVVTNVGLDHTDVLGATRPEIAREKAGIFKPGVPALFACADPAARAVLDESARVVGATAQALGRDFEGHSLDGGEGLLYRGPGGPLGCERLGLAGAHQAANAALALAALGSTPLAIDDQARRRGLAEARWPGRLEWLADDLLVDGAHNPDGARALAAALPRLAGGRPLTLVFGALADKDAAGMLAALVPHAARVIVTAPPSPRALAPDALVALAPSSPSIEIAPSLAAALARARRPGARVLVAGSLLLVGEARRLVLGERADPLAVQDPPAATRAV